MSLRLVAVCALAIAPTACNAGAESAPTTVSPGVVEANAVVDFVVDGDTIDALIDGREERVRLIGIDTPETKRPDTPIECFGPEATAFVESLLPIGTPIRVERDTVSRDDFGRLLGYVYRAADGVFVNYETVRQGYATPLTIEPNDTHAALFVEAARAAEADDVGLWSACSGDGQ
ncbi:MAG: thermonuclease family protein [Ilumatobacter sp.]